MKKFVLIFSLIFLVSNCAVIDKRYTGKRIIVESRVYEEYDDYYSDYDYSPYSYRYRPYYSSPFYWMGFYMWDPYFFWSPFSYYGFYNYYSGYYPGYYGGYYPYNYWSSRYGRSVITKRQLQKRAIRSVIKKSGRRIYGSTKSTGKIRSTVSRSSSSTTSRSTTSSRGSSSKVKKRN